MRMTRKNFKLIIVMLKLLRAVIAKKEKPGVRYDAGVLIDKIIPMLNTLMAITKKFPDDKTDGGK